MEHAAAVLVEEGFRQRAFGDDHVVAVELDVKIFDLVGALGLHDRAAIDEILGLDQHALRAKPFVKYVPSKYMA